MSGMKKYAKKKKIHGVNIFFKLLQIINKYLINVFTIQII